MNRAKGLICTYVALPSVTWSPLVQLRMLKEGKWIILIYLIIKYIYLRIKISDLIQGYVVIKGEEEIHSCLGLVDHKWLYGPRMICR